MFYSFRICHYYWHFFIIRILILLFILNTLNTSLFSFFSKSYLTLLLEVYLQKKKIMRNYIYLKLVFNNSLGILILFFNFFIAYSIFDNHNITLIFITLSILYFIYSYFLIFFSMKKTIYKNWFYFILYLCTLEIIPYYYLISNVL